MRALFLAAALLVAPTAFAQAGLSDAPPHPDARLLTPTELASVGLDADATAWAVPAAELGALGYELPASVLPPEKEVGIAILIGILVPGGGQLYAGDTSKGLRLLGLGYGSLVGGYVLAVATDSPTLALVGYLGYVGATVVGLLDVTEDVEAANRRNGYALGPAMLRTGDGYAPGLALRTSF